MTMKEFREMRFESIKRIIVKQKEMLVKDEFPSYKIDEINLGTINTAAKIYKFNKNQVNELKNLANLS